MRSSFLVLLLAAGAVPARAQTRYKDTAGTFLRAVLASVRQQYPDADLIGISGRTDATWSALCDKDRPADDGWYFHFLSKSAKDSYLLLAECQSYVVGPMKEYVDPGDAGKAITGRFIDNDEAINALAKAGVPIDASDLPGKRPYGFTLLSVEDERFKDNPVFWKVTIGNTAYLVNAATSKVESDVVIRYERSSDGADGGSPSAGATLGASEGGAASPAPAPPPPRGRPKRAKGYTALTDLEAVKAYARQKLPGAALMAVDGIVDSWGHCECFGPGDGWAYYFYYPKTRSIETVFACKGEVQVGESAYIPVDLTYNTELPRGAKVIDSDKALDGLLLSRDSVMNEGMGRYYTRRVPLRLIKYRTSPLLGRYDKTFFWQAEIGSTIYYVDAATGKFVAEKAK